MGPAGSESLAVQDLAADPIDVTVFQLSLDGLFDEPVPTLLFPAQVHGPGTDFPGGALEALATGSTAPIEQVFVWDSARGRGG
ncbi:MAG: hypothetical protein HY903_22575 [Deltaproteobacteria bacterium]|nr:hypothetical protein [Deltaproteobacteria bacterium]